jgi:DNA-binding XRE family transcriptional regulator
MAARRVKKPPATPVGAQPARNVTHRRYTFSLHAGNVAAMAKRAVKPDIRGRFGFAVKDRREELGLTQEDLAEKAGLHRTYVSDIERGTRNLSLLNIERVADALDLAISKLFHLLEHKG